MIVPSSPAGVYFGEPKTITDLGNVRSAAATPSLRHYAIERSAAVAVRSRAPNATIIPLRWDKRNVHE